MKPSKPLTTIGTPIKATLASVTFEDPVRGRIVSLGPGVVGVAGGCPACGGPLRRERGRPAMACYFIRDVPGQIRCLKPEREARR